MHLYGKSVEIGIEKCFYASIWRKGAFIRIKAPRGILIRSRKGAFKLPGVGAFINMRGINVLLLIGETCVFNHAAVGILKGP